MDWVFIFYELNSSLIWIKFDPNCNYIYKKILKTLCEQFKINLFNISNIVLNELLEYVVYISIFKKVYDK